MLGSLTASFLPASVCLCREFGALLAHQKRVADSGSAKVSEDSAMHRTPRSPARCAAVGQLAGLLRSTLLVPGVASACMHRVLPHYTTSQLFATPFAGLKHTQGRWLETSPRWPLSSRSTRMRMQPRCAVCSLPLHCTALPRVSHGLKSNFTFCHARRRTWNSCVALRRPLPAMHPQLQRPPPGTETPRSSRLLTRPVQSRP